MIRAPHRWPIDSGRNDWRVDREGRELMKWTPGGTSQNVEDRRGQTGGGGGFGGGGLRLGLGGAVVLLVLSLIFRQKLFVSFVLDSVQSSWARTLPAMGVPYQDAHLVLFRDYSESACGYAETATGPFYCPGDQKVYIDLGFYQELRDQFGAAGDFAQAYVLAHEIGHHVQTLLGTESRVRRRG